MTNETINGEPQVYSLQYIMEILDDNVHAPEASNDNSKHRFLQKLTIRLQHILMDIESGYASFDFTSEQWDHFTSDVMAKFDEFYIGMDWDLIHSFRVIREYIVAHQKPKKE